VYRHIRDTPKVNGDAGKADEEQPAEVPVAQEDVVMKEA
jgi:hypothetical protein